VDLDGATVLLLLVAGFLAGFVDSIAGGGGLIGIPALLFAGAGPLTALGTNKVQAIFGAAAAARILNLASNLGAFCVFAATGAIDWRVGIMMGIAQLCGAGLGARMAVVNGARLIKPLLVLTCAGMSVRLLVF
jgi:uncharacterized membrane protein YfcA